MNRFLTIVVVLFAGKAAAQSISSETISFHLYQKPAYVVDAASRNFTVKVTSPYNLTTEEIIKKSKEDFKKTEADYSNQVANSKIEYQQKLKTYDEDVAKAKQKYEIESTEFKKFSLLERIAMTDQGKNPRLVLPTKPEYYKPSPPLYREPDLNDYLIVDNNVLASQINVQGFTRGGTNLEVLLDIKAVNFQDNAGQTFANQPTKLLVKLNGVEKINKTFFEEFQFISSSPSNNINKPQEEKNHLNKVVQTINNFLNGQFGYTALEKKVKIETVKNKGQYDDLARAHIYVTTNLKKLQPADEEGNAVAYVNMQKGIDTWLQTLGKIDYKDSKADFNSKIAEYIYFNLIRLNLALVRKSEAEKYLNQLQENLIYIKLSSGQQNELDQLEKDIYKLK